MKVETLEKHPEIPAMMVRLHDFVDAIFFRIGKIFLYFLLAVFLYVIVSGVIFGFCEFLCLINYDLALKHGKGKSALFWIKRHNTLCYYPVKNGRELHLAMCYEMAGNYERAMYWYKYYLRYYDSDHVKFNLCRLLYKSGNTKESFQMYDKTIDMMERKDGNRFDPQYYVIGSKDSYDANLSPFEETFYFQEFMTQQSQKHPDYELKSRCVKHARNLFR